MFRQKGNNIQVTFGKPIDCSTFDQSRSLKEWANLLRDFVYTLEKEENDFGQFLQRTAR